MSDPSVVAASEPAPVTRQERVQRKEDKIVSAARDMFLEGGFKGTTMAQIARASGVADGTLYTYFQNKEALARAVVADFYMRLTQSAQAGVDALSTTTERLKFLARHHLVHVMDERRILEMMPLIDMMLDDYEGSELFSLNKNYVVIFNRVVKDGQASGHINPDLTLWIIRDIFFGGLDYGSRTMFIKGRDEALDSFIEQVVGLILVQPNSGATRVDSAVERLENTAERMEALLQNANLN